MAPARTRYGAREDALMGRNGTRCFNRPLYIANTDAFLLAGDRPAARFVSAGRIHGTFLCGLRSGGRTVWFHRARSVRMELRPARVRWVVGDPAWRGLMAELEVVAYGDEVGFGARFRIGGEVAGGELVWTYAGAAAFLGPHRNLNWDFDPHSQSELSERAFEPALCAGNRASIRGRTFRLAAEATPDEPGSGACSAGEVFVTADPLGLGASGGPAVGGRMALGRTREVAWTFSAGAPSRRDPVAKKPTVRFAAGLKRSAELGSRIVVETPDRRLNVAASLAAAAIDGAWYPPVFRHGCMLWNNRFPGWRTLCGGTALGWHERVRAEARFYCDRQVVRSRLRSGRADPKFLLTLPAKDSRFYGRGRILEDQGIYNMQSQFFDQLAHAWRWTGHPALERRLRPALERHLEWLRDCFDPDGDGLYESVINTWPTDSVWCSGGGATEETSYAYRGHVTARELARRAGDRAAEKRHAAAAGRIARAFWRKLWVRDRGHAGFCREQGGRRRLRKEPWLYSLFLPIDAGLVAGEQAASSLAFAEFGLQNDRMPFGGRRVWTSNFVPGIWSVRECWPGDNYHLALAYFQTGLAEDGWDVFRGAFQQTVFNSRVPGDFGASLGGTDFGDSTHMFVRTLVEGLFGYAPDYPRGMVRIAPRIPRTWKRARLRTPDVSLSFARGRGNLALEVRVARPAEIDLRLAVCAREITAVTVDGRPVRWVLRSAFGRTEVCVALPRGRGGRVVVGVRGEASFFAPVVAEGFAGQEVILRAPRVRLDSFSDRESALADARLEEGAIRGRLGGVAGVHTIAATARFGSAPQWRLFRVRIKPTPQPPPPRAGRRSRWHAVDLGRILNGDVREIFRQRYLSSRPPTVSARIGTDGYSPWTFCFWQSGPPAIDLGRVPAMLSGFGRSRRLLTPQGVPFAWPEGKRNIAFTSQWDNWPGRVSVRVGRSGEAAWFLVCGSTNPMQCRIANAVLRLDYADGEKEAIELVPPLNYWSLCPIRVAHLAPGQENRSDYTARTDAFCLPAVLPATVSLGANCRAMLLSARLRPGVRLERVSLEALSPEVVVGLMGLTVMRRPRSEAG